MLCFFTIYNIIRPYNIFLKNGVLRDFSAEVSKEPTRMFQSLLPGGTLIKDQLRVGCCNPKLYPFSFGKRRGSDYCITS